MNKNEFEKDLKIDPNQLDVEAGMQGEIFFKWAEASVEALREKDLSKLTLGVKIAELSQRARLDPDSFGITRVTEGGINAAVQVHPEMIEAQENYIEVSKNAGLLKEATNAMEQRKRMLEILVTLHGQQYFAGPSVPRNLGDAWKEAQANRETNVQEKQRVKIRRRKKRKKEAPNPKKSK